MTCVVCGSDIDMTFFGPTGWGVCRYPENPNQDDEGQHIAMEVHR